MKSIDSLVIILINILLSRRTILWEEDGAVRADVLFVFVSGAQDFTISC